MSASSALTEDEQCREVLNFFKVEPGDIDNFLSKDDDPSTQKIYQEFLSQFEDPKAGEQAYGTFKSNRDRLKATILSLHEDVTALKHDPVLQNIIKHEELGDVDKVVSEDLEDVATRLHMMNAIIGVTLGIAAIAHAPHSIVGALQANIDRDASTAAGYVDGVAMMAGGLREFREGHRAAGAVTMATGAGLTSCTIAGNVTATIGASSGALSAGLLGFSYVGALSIMTAMSTGRMLKAQHRRELAEKEIVVLETKLNETDHEINQMVDTLEEKSKALDTLSKKIDNEKASLSATIQPLIALYDEREKKESAYHDKLRELDKEVATLSKASGNKEVNAIKIVKLEKDKAQLKQSFNEALSSINKKINSFEFKEASDKASVTPYVKRAQLKEEIADLTKQKNTKIEAKQAIDKEIDAQVEKKFNQGAKEKDHARAAKGFGAVTIAMGAVATVSFLALSGMTMGALPAAMVVLSVTALAANYFRHKWASKISHASNLAESKGLKLIEQRKELKNHQCGIDLDKPIELKSSLLGKVSTKLAGRKSTMTFRAYIDDLILNDPKKAKKVMDAYQTNNKPAFIDALRQKRSKEVKGNEKDFYHGVINAPESGKALVQAYQNGGSKGIKRYLNEKVQAHQSHLGRFKKLGNTLFQKTGMKKFRSTGLHGAELAAYRFLEDDPARFSTMMEAYAKHPDGDITELARMVEALPSSSDKTTGMKLLEASEKQRDEENESINSPLEQESIDEEDTDGEGGQDQDNEDDPGGLTLS